MADDSSTARPWGRFKCVSRHPAAESDHVYFTLPHHRIGRVVMNKDSLLAAVIVSKRVRWVYALRCVLDKRTVVGIVGSGS